MGFRVEGLGGYGREGDEHDRGFPWPLVPEVADQVVGGAVRHAQERHCHAHEHHLCGRENQRKSVCVRERETPRTRTPSVRECEGARVRESRGTPLSRI